MISLNKNTGNCNVLSPKIFVPKEIKDIIVKSFNMITNKNEAKAEHISCDCKCKFISTTCSSNHKWNNKTCQYDCKNYRKCKKDDNSGPSTCICVNSKYLKVLLTLQWLSLIIIIVMDIVLTKKPNTVATNVTNAASINCQSKRLLYKKVRDGYILQTVVLMIILLLIAIIICYYYPKQKMLTH